MRKYAAVQADVYSALVEMGADRLGHGYAASAPTAV